METIGGRYELGRTLGAGGMARVVEAYDPVLDRSVAVKLLRDDIATDSSVRERFLREARTAARFNHPNAVAVYDTGQDGRQPWIVMELVRGRDLAARLVTDGALGEREAVRVTDAVLAALEAAHRGGMVHRDVKPGNIMLLDDGGVKLADFGIAKSVQEATAGLTSTGQIIGTAKYLSPEQVEGHPATPASDVYATGVVLYEMLAGDPPFTGDSAIAIALAHTREAVPDLRRVAPGTSPGVAAVVKGALTKNPQQRYRDAGEMRRALAGESVVAGGAAATAVIDRAETTQVLPRERSPQRSPWPLLLLALAALLGFLALLAMLDGEEPTTDPQRTAPAEAEEQQQQEQPEPEQPTTQPQPTEQPEDEEQQPPTDLPSLISFLEENPDQFGKSQKDLLKGLEEVQELDGAEQASKADDLQEKIAEWVEKDELDPSVGQLAISLLDPIAATAPPDNGNGNGQGNGQGEGKGKGPDKDDD
ncbi:MAG: protein kinase [Nitriliruptorales bacterium]|nr:protein kinase [Nitriliruptorales bacterium]